MLYGGRARSLTQIVSLKLIGRSIVGCSGVVSRVLGKGLSCRSIFTYDTSVGALPQVEDITVFHNFTRRTDNCRYTRALPAGA
jgi:hypothetical protein